eukprot:6450999-Ditylum_brightwellii.AAC.1
MVMKTKGSASSALMMLVLEVDPTINPNGFSICCLTLIAMTVTLKTVIARTVAIDSDAENGDHKYSGTGSALKMVALEADCTIYMNGFTKWHLTLITGVKHDAAKTDQKDRAACFTLRIVALEALTI